MKYVASVALALSFLAGTNAVLAADDSASAFYALGDLNRVKNDSRQPRKLSDVQLASVEGSAWFPRLSDHIRRGELRELMFQFLVFRLLADHFHGNGVTSMFGQNNFLIQINIAIGNDITQSNNAVQWNAAALSSRLH